MSEDTQQTASVTQEDAEDSTPQVEDVQEAAEGTEVDESSLDARAKAALEKVRREARNLRQRIKELEPAARKLKDIEDKDKSESQRLNEKLTALEQQLAEYKVREVRTAAAAAAGLPVSMAQFITAADPEEAKQQAKTLAEFGKTQADFKQGARKTPPAGLTGDELLRKMAGRQ